MLPTSLPTPELFLPGRGEPSLRWGIVGTGWVGRFFPSALRAHTGQSVVAVTSLRPERAAAFAAEHGIAVVHESVEAMAADPGIDVMYIAAPQADHLRLGLIAIAGGKHVLMEKPLATSAVDAQTLIDAARAEGVFLMEAMWSRYQPQALTITRLIADGVIGDVCSVVADHGQALAADPHHRLLQPGTGGGALLDLGIYPIQLDSMVRGAPTGVTAIGALAPSGVDAYATVVLDHDAGEQSTLMASIVTKTPGVAAISGTEATLQIEAPFHFPTAFTLRSPDFFEPALRWRDETGVELMDALAWQATALARYVGEGRAESPLHTHAETVSILATIDEARRQLGAR
ncbi:Gfo/Idh/MocA family protein [Microbacterium sp. NPDC091313]